MKNDADLARIRGVADYQFGKGFGKLLFPIDVKIEYSKRTGRIRYVHLEGARLVTMKPTDGFFALSLEGARKLLRTGKEVRFKVIVRNGVAKFIAEGGDVFSVHVIQADEDIRARNDVVVVDHDDSLLAVGRAMLSGCEMLEFKRGIAVKVRRGCDEER